MRSQKNTTIPENSENVVCKGWIFSLRRANSLKKTYELHVKKNFVLLDDESTCIEIVRVWPSWSQMGQS